VGTWGNGLTLFDFKKRAFEKSYVFEEKNDRTISNNFIKSMTRDEKGNLWLATWGGGIEKFNITSGSFEHFNSKHPRRVVLFNYIAPVTYFNGYIWSANNKGLLKYEEAADSFRLFPAMKDSVNIFPKGIQYLEAVSENEIWIGAWKGYGRYLIKENRFETYDAFSNDIVTAVHHEGNGTLWLATSNGLKHFYPSSG
jgi:ligand-binding sensor domain-containing protein